MFWRRRKSNCGPPVTKASALTVTLAGPGKKYTYLLRNHGKPNASTQPNAIYFDLQPTSLDHFKCKNKFLCLQML